jgi:hypothetical protein
MATSSMRSPTTLHQQLVKMSQPDRRCRLDHTKCSHSSQWLTVQSRSKLTSGKSRKAIGNKSETDNIQTSQI